MKTLWPTSATLGRSWKLVIPHLPPSENAIYGIRVLHKGGRSIPIVYPTNDAKLFSTQFKDYVASRYFNILSSLNLRDYALYVEVAYVFPLAKLVAKSTRDFRVMDTKNRDKLTHDVLKDILAADDSRFVAGLSVKCWSELFTGVVVVLHELKCTTNGASLEDKWQPLSVDPDVLLDDGE